MSLAWFAAVLGALAVGTTASTIKPALYPRDTVTPLENLDLSFSGVNEQLFSITEDGITVSLECVSCETSGTAQVSTSGIDRHDGLIGALEDLIDAVGKEIDSVIGKHVSSEIYIEFVNTSATFDMGIDIAASGTHSFNLLTVPFLGAAASFNKDDTIGVSLVLDLLITLSAGVDIRATFDFSLPDGANIAIDPINAAIINSTGFAGNDLNVTTTLLDPSVGFSASLRATILTGVTVKVGIPHIAKDFNAVFDVGVFADLVKYDANVTSSDQFLSTGTLPSATTTANPPIATNITFSNRTISTGHPTSCSNVLTESLSIDIGIFTAATLNATEANQHSDEPGQLNLFTHTFAPVCV